jgi:hypothetical protein
VGGCPHGGVRLPDTEVTGESAGIGTVDLVLFSVELCHTPPAAEAIAKADLHEVEAE